MSAIRPDLVPSLDEMMRLRQVSIGAEPADLILRGGMVLSVHTGEFLHRDVVIAGRHIAAVTPVGAMDGDAEGTQVVDLHGKFVTPSFIDSHLHIEYTMLTPGELARLSVARGTTTVLTDPDCMANVAGLAGMDYMRTTGTPLRIIEQVSPATPVAPHLERGGAIIPEQAVRDRVAEPGTATLGEGNPFDYGETATGRFREAVVQGRRITGHSARQSGPGLWGYLSAGVSDDHNAATLDEVMERVRLGMMITVMSGSMNNNITPIFADLDAVTPALGHLSFCADDKHALDLSGEGHIDHHVRQVIAAGVDPAQAYRMATWQPALYYRLDHVVGSVTPSRLADLLILDDLADARPTSVYVGGRLVARDGVALFENTDEVPAWTAQTMVMPEDFGSDRLKVAADGDTAWVQAMEMYDGYFKRAFHVELPVVDGSVQGDTDRDVLKIAVVDRHHGDGLSAMGFVRGFTLRSGAIAASMNCTNMNVVVVGTNDDDMAAAVRALRDSGGGFVAVSDETVRASVPLPVGGLMSAAPWEETAAALETAHDVVTGMGCTIHSPFMILSFVGLGVVPDLGLTELGLIDATSQSFTDLLLTAGEDGVRCRCPHHSSAVHALPPLAAREG